MFKTHMSVIGLALAVPYLNEATDEAGSPGDGGAKTAIRPDLTNYQAAKSATGSSTKICGDAVSLVLVGATLDETYGFVSKVVGIGEDVLREKYSGSNLGQQRMFLGNLIRGGMAGKDEAKAKRISDALDALKGDFRVAIDARQASATAEAEKAKAAKVKEREDAKTKKKAEAEAKRKEAAAKKAADAEAKASAAADPKKPAGTAQATPAKTAAPKAPTQAPKQ